MNETKLAEMLMFFKALSDESRLKIVGSLASSERSVEELASLLDLRAPTVSHHLAKLKNIDLVSMRSEGNTHFYSLNNEALRSLSREILKVDKIASQEQLDSHAWERKIIKDFFTDSKLKVIPASRKKRTVILKWLVERFKKEKKYSEKEVNKIIKKHHDDFATLRRELVGASLMKRKAGVYWRVD